jgi:hypothetical protein
MHNDGAVLYGERRDAYAYKYEEKCINTKDFNRAFHGIASHILLVRTDLQGSGFDDIKLKKIHINDAIKVVEDLVSGYTRAYDLLSKFFHPNSFGVFCSFCSYSSEAGKTTFLDSQAIEGKTIANCISSLISVPVFGRAWSRVKDIGEKIAVTEWSGDDNLGKLFRSDKPIGG